MKSILIYGNGDTGKQYIALALASGKNFHCLDFKHSIANWQKRLAAVPVDTEVLLIMNMHSAYLGLLYVASTGINTKKGKQTPVKINPVVIATTDCSLDKMNRADIAFRSGFDLIHLDHRTDKVAPPPHSADNYIATLEKNGSAGHGIAKIGLYAPVGRHKDNGNERGFKQAKWLSFIQSFFNSAAWEI